MDRMYWAALQQVAGIGSRRLRRLVGFFGDACAAWQSSSKQLAHCNCLDAASLERLLAFRAGLDVAAMADRWRLAGILISRPGDANYPALLKATVDRPELLYYRGSLPNCERLIAIVGARKASAYGKNAARMLASGLAEAGVCVVSGAARGIDTAAHVGALMQGRTIAVLGSGVDVSYPPENLRLLEQIAQTGAVVSEYPPGTAPHAAYFPARNRIISGLARGVAIVEAGEKSGALITADQALEEGRDVFAVPGSIFSSTSRGAHKLIQQGAKLVGCVDDILEEYDWERPISDHAKLQLSADEFIVYNQLKSGQPMAMEELIAATALTAPALSYILLQLELRGLIVECYAQHFIRAKGDI